MQFVFVGRCKFRSKTAVSEVFDYTSTTICARVSLLSLPLVFPFEIFFSLFSSEEETHMNDVQQQVFVKPHPQPSEHTFQGNTECWSLILDEGLLQVDYTNCAIFIVIAQ